MSDRTKVYVVTSGSYSDYGIRCVFTDKALAEEYVRRYNLVGHYSDAEIEEFDANAEELMEPLAMTRCFFPIVPTTLGVMDLISSETVFIDPAEQERKRRPYVSSDAILVVIGTNEEQAFKIGCDWWAQEKAKRAEGVRNEVDNLIESLERQKLMAAWNEQHARLNPGMASMGTAVMPMGFPVLPS